MSELRKLQVENTALKAQLGRVRQYADDNRNLMGLSGICDILSTAPEVLAVVEGYSLKDCFPEHAFDEGRMQIYEEQYDEMEIPVTIIISREESNE